MDILKYACLLATAAAAFCQIGAASADDVAPGPSRIDLSNSRLGLVMSRAGGGLILHSLTDPMSKFNWAVDGALIGPVIAQNGAQPGLPAPVMVNRKPSTSRVRGSKVASHQETWAPGWHQIDWSAKSFPDVGVVEFRATLRNKGISPVEKISALGALTFKLRKTNTLRFYWLNRSAYRLQNAELKEAFKAAEGTIPDDRGWMIRGTGPNESFQVSGGSKNAPGSAGWLAVEDPTAKEVLFIGTQWESYWRFKLQHDGPDLLLSCYLEGFDRSLGQNEKMEAPTVFVGVSHGDLDDSLRVLHDYLKKHVMPPKLTDFPWVTYDIWGTESSGVEDSLYKEIPFARDLGVEVFYHDASWWDGSCKDGSGDWFMGVGNWGKDDRVKLPNGLAGLSKKVHAAGMKFGLWFAPQVADSGLIGRVIPDKWLVKRDGRNVVLDLGNGWPSIIQICLGDPEVVGYLKNALAAAVTNYSLDWIKWDNSGLDPQVCNRTDHGHGAGNCTEAALRGEYQIFSYLHKRFPNLVLENCGYPSRMDYGLAPYTRSLWLSDDTSDATRCRRSQIHGSYILPSACNEAFVINGGEMQEKDPALLDTAIRSRMVGLFGMGTMNGMMRERMSLLSPEAKQALKRNIANYKRYRHLLWEDVYHVLPLADTATEWDGVEFCKRDGSEAVLMLFRGQSPDESNTIRLRGLKPGKSYEITSFNTGKSRLVDSSELQKRGLDAVLPKLNGSEILLLKIASK